MSAARLQHGSSLCESNLFEESAADMRQYERYRTEEAPRLQAEANERFGGRFHAFRTLLEVVHDA